jgi:hypothetical protein
MSWGFLGEPASLGASQRPNHNEIKIGWGCNIPESTCEVPPCVPALWQRLTRR